MIQKGKHCGQKGEHRGQKGEHRGQKGELHGQKGEHCGQKGELRGQKGEHCGYNYLLTTSDKINRVFFDREAVFQREKFDFRYSDTE